MHNIILAICCIHYLLVGGVGFKLGSSGFSNGGGELPAGERGGSTSGLCLAALSKISCSSLVPKSRSSAKQNM